jgi:putative flippase GtrA
MPENIGSFFLKFLKFALVGLTGFIIDFGITFLVKERLRWNKYVANSLGFVLASVNNYVLNRLWTFRSNEPEIGWQFSKFLLVALTGLVFNNLVVYLLTDKVRLNFYFAKFIAIVLVFIWSFLLNYHYTFTR